MVFFLPPKYPPLSRDFFLDMMKCPLTARPPDPITIRKGNRGGGGGGTTREEVLQTLRFTQPQPLPFLPVSLFQPLPIHPPQPPKVGRPQRKSKKSSLAPTLAGDQHLFCSRRTHSPLTSLGAAANPQSSSAAGPSSRAPGPRGGQEGTVPYKPRLSGLRRPRRQRCTGGAEGDPCRVPGPTATTSLSSSPSPPYLYPSLSPSPDPYL